MGDGGRGTGAPDVSREVYVVLAKATTCTLKARRQKLCIMRVYRLEEEGTIDNLPWGLLIFD
jgi:hypothetical protein